MLDGDPVWDQHSGGEGHSGREWRDGDGPLAEAFYAALPDSAKFVFDLMMNRPGEQVTSDWIAGQLSRYYDGEARRPGRQSVSAILSSVSQPHRRSGRRLPFYWWRQHGGATLYAMKPGVARLFREARQSTAGADPDPGGDWSASEVVAVVRDYLEMLRAEIAGQQYVKAHHRRALLSRLNPVRTGGAVEYKHQNISAAMLDLGLPWIRGYKPMSNYQDALADEIQRQLEADPGLLRTLRDSIEKDKTQDREDDATPKTARLQQTPVPAPPAPVASSPGARSRAGRHPDYGLLHEENTRRGRLGEELVIDYERDWLTRHGRPDLADAVRWTSRQDGDGLGYDVLSFGLDGRKRYIEVKATALGDGTPFYITSAELDFAQRHADSHALYRVYDVLGKPRFYVLEGDINDALDLAALTYSARITASGS
jgi:Family of unknown function (DUF6416)/Domain of unknown function (DUF3883)